MLSKLSAVATLGRQAPRAAAALTQVRGLAYDASGFGDHVFKGDVADKYLKKHGKSAAVLDDPMWTQHSSDEVAAAVMDWALDNGASVFTHWFQPQGASGVRHGLTGQVQNHMFAFDKAGKPVFELKGKDLRQGETDGSSYQSGGLRATHTAGGYTVIDPTSPIMLRGDTIFIPSVFVSFYGQALDEKTPLMRAMQACSKEGKRLAKNLGWEIDGLTANIGLEQEIFLIPREEYQTRMDLQLAGRTIMGKDAPRGQEMCDHYMAAMNPMAGAALLEMQEECFAMGIPLKTRHREVAPNQYEVAPLFGQATSQIDQNLMVMQVIEEVAARHGLAALLQEKPFNNINGSGKHNNWSLGTTCTGANLLNVKQVTEASGSPDTFPVVMAAMVRMVDMHGDLMRMSIASPGNDFRLGACEAPPAIVSTYLGDDMTSFLEAYKSGDVKAYVPNTKEMDVGIESIAPFTVPSEDRNRTSPFPYGGHRFEFRAVGSSQNVSMVNTVLCLGAADSFAALSDKIEAGAKPSEAAIAMLNEHWKCIFNGNGYSEEWPIEAGEKGVTRIDSGVESNQVLTSPKNIALMEKYGVLTEAECIARAAVLHDHYSGTVEIEALCMIDMIKQQIIPACKEAGVGSVADLTAAADTVKAKLGDMHAAESEYEKAKIARELRLEVMIDAREVCDKTEAEVPANLWPMATYKELLFLDQNQ